jgi:hypothetical protein
MFHHHLSSIPTPLFVLNLFKQAIPTIQVYFHYKSILNQSMIINHNITFKIFIAPFNIFFNLSKSCNFLFDFFVIIKGLINSVFDVSHSYLIFELLFFLFAKSQLFTLPVHLVNNKGIRNTHVTSSSTSTLLRINILMDDINKLLL